MKKSILVVEDQLINQRILKAFLENHYNVICAENGQEALDILAKESENITAILLDLIMPVMDGYEFLKRYSQIPEYKEIPVIVTTEDEGGEQEEKALELGANDFVGKPYNPNVLLKRLDNLISLKRTLTILADAERDTLTGLYNRKAFYRNVRKILNDDMDNEYEIIVIDLEKFKMFNATFGWGEGDKLLKFIARYLEEAVQEINGVCAHGHGDIFYSFAKQKDNLLNILEGIEKVVAHEYKEGIPAFKYGIYKITDRNVVVNTMCDNAVVAANQIKGRYNLKSYVYDEAIKNKLLMDQKITGIMQQALEQGQFKVFYQPKYDIMTGRMIGAEALVRWQHPELGFLPPDHFIPLFENNGFITNLDVYVWKKVCSFLERLEKKYGRDLPISVNVSRKDIYIDGIPELLEKIVNKHNLPVSHLHLEITETAYTENTDQLLSVIKRFKKMGFIIEMDDFGRGYSSLNFLAQLPIDTLKIDMKFIQTENKSKNSHNIMSSIVNLAKWMNLMVVVEGVETTAQVEYLKDLKCNFAQGYYYASPMEEKEFEEIFKDADVTPMYDMNAFMKSIAERSRELDLDKETILIADPLGMNREIIKESLEDKFQFVEVENSEQLLKMIENDKNGLVGIILDLDLPGDDAYSILERIKENSGLVNVPVIVTSARMDTIDKKEALKRGADDFLFKPYEKKDINQILTNKVEQYKREALRSLREAEMKATTDGMTGLFNRKEFERRVNDYFEKNPDGPATFLIIDIDNFKGVNDSLGHIIGDQAIIEVADVLKSSFRSNDAVCRFGGDEFAVFLKLGFKSTDLNIRMEKLCEKLRVSVGEMKISCSVGVCQCPEFGSDYHTLYKNADIALMTSKRLGKNQYQVYGDDFNVPIGINSRNLDWLLDEVSDAIFVCDEESYELLYMNEVAARKLACKTKKEAVGKFKKCYEIIWGRTTPCECCAINSYTEKGVYYQKKLENQKTGNMYDIRTKIVNWSGKNAQIHFAKDITNETKNLKKFEDTYAALDYILKEQEIYFWVYDIEKHTCMNSDSAVKDLGLQKFMVNYPESILKGEFIPNDDKGQFRNLHRKLENGERYVQMKGHGLDKKGNLKEVAISYFVIDSYDTKKAIGMVKFQNE